MTDQTTNTLKSIAIEKLVASDKNVRKTSSDKNADEALLASIREVGLINNLVVIPGDEDSFSVIAGGRRLTALQTLVKSGYLNATDEIPCMVINGDVSGELLSLTENVQRQAMHAADEFEAFKALIDAGTSVSEVAKQFGTTEVSVKRRLKLADVSPDIIDAYRAGALSLDCVMAFTVESDQHRQYEVWCEICGGHFNDRTIRDALTKTSIASTQKLARFITVDAYKKVGGAITEDLFSDEGTVYLEDRELVGKLALEKLESAAAEEKLTGWGWVLVTLEQVDIYGTDRIYSQRPDKLPDDVKAESDRIEAGIEALEDIDEEEWTEEQDTEWNQLDSDRDAISEKIDSLCIYDPDEKKLAGCYVSVGYGGDLKIDRGFVNKSDKAALAALRKGEEVNTGDSNAPDAPDLPKTYNAALQQDITAYRLAIAKAEMAKHPSVVKDMLGYSLAIQVLSGGYQARPLDIRITTTPVNSSRDDIAGSPLEAAMEAGRKKLSLGWLKKKSDKTMFAAYCELKPKEKDDIAAFCAIRALYGQQADGNNDIIEVGMERCKIDWAKHWRPTVDNFFGRITKPQLIEIGTELVGDEWPAQVGTLKKAELAQRTYQLINCEGVKLTKEQQAACKAWLPVGF